MPAADPGQTKILLNVYEGWYKKRPEMLPTGAPRQDMLRGGEQGRGPAWEGAVERGTRQSCPDLL